MRGRPLDDIFLGFGRIISYLQTLNYYWFVDAYLINKMIFFIELFKFAIRSLSYASRNH